MTQGDCQWRISVLTLSGSVYGFQVLNLLQRRGVSVEQVVVLDALWRTRYRSLKRWIRQVGLIDALLFAAWGFTARVLHQPRDWRGQPLERDYRRLAARVERAAFPRSPETAALLRAVQPDLLLLAHSGIVPQAVLDAPRLATLNAHPGLLPEIRGFDPELWAIETGQLEAVGCTLHVVDRGVDTGPILRRVAYRWRGDETLALLVERLQETCVDLLVEACQTLTLEELATAQPQGAGAQFYLMPLRRRPVVARKLRAFLEARAAS
jgi:folate-dependent phosphoribosylglycinamide formyltransferase PurN